MLVRWLYSRLPPSALHSTLLREGPREGRLQRVPSRSTTPGPITQKVKCDAEPSRPTTSATYAKSPKTHNPTTKPLPPNAILRHSKDGTPANIDS